MLLSNLINSTFNRSLQRWQCYCNFRINSYGSEYDGRQKLLTIKLNLNWFKRSVLNLALFFYFHIHSRLFSSFWLCSFVRCTENVLRFFFFLLFFVHFIRIYSFCRVHFRLPPIQTMPYNFNATKYALNLNKRNKNENVIIYICVCVNIISNQMKFRSFF